MPLNAVISTNYLSLNLVEEIKETQKYMCQEHVDYKAGYICLKDKCRACLYCKIYGMHKNHDLVPKKEFDEKVEKKTMEIESSLETFKSLSAEFLEFYQEEKAKLTKSIEERYDKLIKILNQIKIETVFRVHKSFGKIINKMKNHKVYQNVLGIKEVFESKISQLPKDKNSEKYVREALYFYQTSWSLPGKSWPYFEKNKNNSIKFFSQTSDLVKKQVQEILRTLHNNSQELENTLLSFSLCQGEQVVSEEVVSGVDSIERAGEEINGQGKQELVISISTAEGCFGMEVKASETIQSFQQKLIEMGKCNLDDRLCYQNYILQGHLTIFDYNIQTKSSVFVRKAEVTQTGDT